MRVKLCAGLFALGLMCLCAVRVTAQEMVTLPANGLYQLPQELLEQVVGVDYEWITVTLPPAPSRGALYLDGEQLGPYRMISREEAQRVWCFAARGAPVTIGVSALPERLLPREPRILCINREF